jgi:hypothetical protein
MAIPDYQKYLEIATEIPSPNENLRGNGVETYE